MLKIRRSHDRLSLTWESHTWERQSLYWDGTQDVCLELENIVGVTGQKSPRIHGWFSEIQLKTEGASTVRIRIIYSDISLIIPPKLFSFILSLI